MLDNAEAAMIHTATHGVKRLQTPNIGRDDGAHLCGVSVAGWTNCLALSQNSWPIAMLNASLASPDTDAITGG